MAVFGWLCNRDWVATYAHVIFTHVTRAHIMLQNRIGYIFEC